MLNVKKTASGYSPDSTFEVDTANGPRQFTVSAPSYADALRALIAAGDDGITQRDVAWWTTRLAPKVHQLRHRYGLDIVTINERHSNGGVHARYVLRGEVRAMPNVQGGSGTGTAAPSAIAA